MMSQDPYQGLREKLEELTWPRIYLFKFIVPNTPELLAQAMNLFDQDEAQLEQRHSKSGKFVSVSAKEMMMSPERVIERYQQAEKIPGLMAL